MERFVIPQENTVPAPPGLPVPASVAFRSIGTVRTVAMVLAFGLAGCYNVYDVPTNPSAPGGWQWFRATAPADREAYYSRRCSVVTERAQCVMNLLLRGAIRTCRIELGSEKDASGEAAVRQQRTRIEACASALLAPHGVLALDPDLEGYPDL